MKAKHVPPFPFQAMTHIPSGVQVEEHESIVRRDLPVLANVEAASTEEERMRAYVTLVEKQRAEFIRTYGDPYGQTVETTKAPVHKIKVVSRPLPAITLGAA